MWGGPTERGYGVILITHGLGEPEYGMTAFQRALISAESGRVKPENGFIKLLLTRMYARRLYFQNMGQHEISI